MYAIYLTFINYYLIIAFEQNTDQKSVTKCSKILKTCKSSISRHFFGTKKSFKTHQTARFKLQKKFQDFFELQVTCNGGVNGV